MSMADPSPILDAARRLADLTRQYAAAGYDNTAAGLLLEAIMPLEEQIVAATPSTQAEALVVLMVAASVISIGNDINDAEPMVERGELAVRRATTFLAGAHGVDLAAFGSATYLPPSLVPHMQAGTTA